MSADLDAIEAREKAASPGPWLVSGWQDPDEFWFGDGYYEGGPAVLGSNGEADAEFIGHARADVPALVAEVRRLREKVAALEESAFQSTMDARWDGC